jgi:hypothetical protein
MTNQSNTVRHAPRLTIDAEAITSRLHSLADTRLCGQCHPAVAALIADATHLLTETARLYDGLLAARLESANLRAAISATLGADADGEPDPLAYLRDELPEPGQHDRLGRGWCR